VPFADIDNARRRDADIAATADAHRTLSSPIFTSARRLPPSGLLAHLAVTGAARRAPPRPSALPPTATRTLHGTTRSAQHCTFWFSSLLPPYIALNLVDTATSVCAAQRSLPYATPAGAAPLSAQRRTKFFSRRPPPYHLTSTPYQRHQTRYRWRCITPPASGPRRYRCRVTVYTRACRWRRDTFAAVSSPLKHSH